MRFITRTLSFIACLAILPVAGQSVSKPGAIPSFDDAPTEKVDPLKVALMSEVKAAAPGQSFKVAVKLEHAPHWHSYGKTLPEDVIGKPTRLIWTLPAGWEAEDLPWPDTHAVPSTDGKMSIGYDGVVYLPALIKPAPGAAVGSEAEIQVTVDALVCDPSNCMPVKPDASLKIKVASAAEIDPANAAVFPAEKKAAASAQPDASEDASSKAGGGHGTGVLLLFAFIGGLILNIMPCVFPVLGIKVMGVVQQAGEHKAKVKMHGLAYTAGVLVSFWALAGLVIALGKGWGFQLQSPFFVFGLACFFLIFSLNMAGVFEIGASAVGVGAELQSKQGLSGSFFSGLLATVVATPCSAPFLGPALGFAVTLPAPLALGFFTVIALGLASPFLLLSFAPGLVSVLPRPGAWMESFKQGMSFLLFATVAFLIWVLAGLVKESLLQHALFGLVVIAFGCWIYGRWHLPHKPARTRMIALAFTLAAVASGLWLGWPSEKKGELEWAAWTPQVEQQLIDSQKPVYIDFTARWCATCQVNKRVYKDAELKKLFRGKGVTLLKGDWTNEDPAITEALKKLGKAAVPVNVLYIPGQKEPVILPELLTVENVGEALSKLP